MKGLKNPIYDYEAVNKLYVDEINKKIDFNLNHIRFDYFSMFGCFIDFISPSYFKIDDKYIVDIENNGNIEYEVIYFYPKSITGFTSQGLYLNELEIFFNNEYKEFTFFISFHHKKAQDMIIDFHAKNAVPSTPKCFRL